MKNLIFGGTFDPIHKGHLFAAKKAMMSYGFDGVTFIPAGNPWMKNYSITSSFHRLNMLKLAINSSPEFSVSDVEIQRGGPSYMIDTLLDMSKEKNKQEKFCILLGSDVLNDIHKWHKSVDLVKIANFFVIHRPGSANIDLNAIKVKFYDIDLEINVIKGDFSEVSSKEIRQRIKRGLSLTDMIPKSVEEYIKIKGLYDE